jgi:hypothetical protein
MENQPNAMVIICKCGSAFAACITPECYTDKDWQKDLRKYVKEGCTVEMRHSGDFNFERCKCNEKQEAEIKNQLSLF